MGNTANPGLAPADYLRRGPWLGRTHLCHSCEREVLEHLEDMTCSQCRGVVPDDTEFRRKARIELYTRTAKRCREWGDVPGAEWFEERIKAEGGK